MGLTFAPACIFWLLFCLAIYTLLGDKINKNKLRGKFVGGILLGVASLFMFYATQPSITYKHATGYDKSQDVNNIHMQGYTTSSMYSITDKTLKPKTTDESRKQSFNESISY